MAASQEAAGIGAEIKDMLASSEQVERHVIGFGIDVVEMAKVQTFIDSENFVELAFTPVEISYCNQSAAMRAQRYAARWATKEAVVKALRTKKLNPLEISIEHDREGMPCVVLSGKAQDRATEIGVSTLLITLSHETSIAMAACIALGNAQRQ